MFFPDPGRAEAVMTYVGEGSPSFRRTALDVPMCERTAYKVIQALIEDGALWVTPGIPGMTSGRLNASQWLKLTDDGRDRAASALERAADSLEDGMTSKEEQDRRREASLTAVEQRERTLVALERIADALERMAKDRAETHVYVANASTTVPMEYKGTKRWTSYTCSSGPASEASPGPCSPTSWPTSSPISWRGRSDARGRPDGHRGPGREGRGEAGRRDPHHHVEQGATEDERRPLREA
jgi:hypothetical protein